MDNNKKAIILFFPSPWPGEARGRIPYALLYLERMARDFGLEIIMIDEQVEKNYIAKVEAVKDRLLLAGVSSMTGHQIIGGIRFSKLIKNICGAPVVWGGWHPTLLAEETLREAYVDFVIIGQGEIAFKELVRHIISGHTDYSGLSGLGYKRDRKIIINKRADFININQFSKVNFKLLDLNNYVFKSAYSERCLGYFSSHGCPFNCAFCCVAEVYGRRWYNKEIAEIIADLQYFKAAANIDSITFDDDNFFVNQSFSRRLCQEMINSKLNLKWDTSAHAALFNKLFSEQDLDLFYQAGCRQIYVGAESGDQEILDLIDKKSKVEDNLKFVSTLNKHNITPLFSTMICFPVNPDKDIKLTIDMIRRAKLIDHKLRARLFFYTPYPGTRLFRKAVEQGFNPPAELEKWAGHTLRKFKAPWWVRDYRREIEIFSNFYLPMVNPDFYKMVPKFKIIVYLINKIFYPLAYLRFKYNFLKYPVEAILFLKILRLFNKLFNQNFSLGYESYLN